jgi:hypothetical protein
VTQPHHRTVPIVWHDGRRVSPHFFFSLLKAASTSTFEILAVSFASSILQVLINRHCSLLRSSSNSMATLAGIQRLPNELLLDIFSMLDRPPPSDSRLHDQPLSDWLKSKEDQPLKSSSRVCRRWRAVCSPLLFRHVFWTLDSTSLRTGADDFELFSFLRDHDLQGKVQTLTIQVRDCGDAQRSRKLDDLAHSSRCFSPPIFTQSTMTLKCTLHLWTHVASFTFLDFESRLFSWYAMRVHARLTSLSGAKPLE